MLLLVVMDARVTSEMVNRISESELTIPLSGASDVQDAMEHTAKMERDKYLKLLNIMQPVLL